EDIDMAAIGDRRGRCRAILLVEFFVAITRRLAPPQDLAVSPVQRDRQQFLAFKGGKKNAIPTDHRRRVSRRQRDFPNYVLAGTDAIRQCGGFRNTQTIGPSESVPVGGASGCRQRRRENEWSNRANAFQHSWRR